MAEACGIDANIDTNLVYGGVTYGQTHRDPGRSVLGTAAIGLAVVAGGPRVVRRGAGLSADPADVIMVRGRPLERDGLALIELGQVGDGVLVVLMACRRESGTTPDDKLESTNR